MEPIEKTNAPEPTNAIPNTNTPQPTNSPPSEPEQQAAPQKPEITYDDFTKLDLRVATILEAENHPNADRLLKLQIDVGELGKRQICAGIRSFYTEPAELVGRQIIIVANLAPRKIRGEISNGMLLAASVIENDDLKDIVLLTPDKITSPGSTVG